jgi:hypothetical protein
MDGERKINKQLKHKHKKKSSAIMKIQGPVLKPQTRFALTSLLF